MVLSLFNLLYQLVIAHQLSAVDFASFNSILSLFVLVSAPLTTLQPVIAKYCAEYQAKSDGKRIQILLSFFIRNVFFVALAASVIFYFASIFIIPKLKIYSSGIFYILPLMFFFAWFTPVLFGGLQGLERFKWLMYASIGGGGIKLLLAFIFIGMGFGISGAFGAFLASSVIIVIIALFPIKEYILFSGISDEIIDFKQIASFVAPVAIATFCYVGLVNLDMIMVKYFFLPEEAGMYSLAQVAGKIFLFLPGAISIVMFPRVSHLNAKNENTLATLNRSLFYGFLLCIAGVIIYNLFPSLVLSILTGKAPAQSIKLGRLFSVSMTFFALFYILVNYFLSLKDFRFIKYLVSGLVLQVTAIWLFHNSPMHVQLILCINAITLFGIHLGLVYKKQGQPPNRDTIADAGTVPVKVTGTVPL